MRSFLLCVTISCFTSVFADEYERPTVTAEPASVAITEFEQGTEGILKSRITANTSGLKHDREAISAALQTLIVSLKAAQESATKSGDLDSAVQIRDAVTYYESLSPDVFTADLGLPSDRAKIRDLENQIARLERRLRVGKDTPRAEIPSNAVRASGHSYLAVPGPATWHQAVTWCESKGGYLVRIQSHAEHQFVQQLLRSSGVGMPAWIGGTDEADEGVWRFDDGTPLEFTAFMPGQPNNGSPPYEHYLHIGEAGWADMFAGRRLGFVCEWGEDRITKP